MGKNDAPVGLSKKEAKKKSLPLIGYGDEAAQQGFLVSDLTGNFS